MATAKVSLLSSPTQFPRKLDSIQRVALYARVSTSNGHQDPEMQLRALRAYAELRAWQIAGKPPNGYANIFSHVFCTCLFTLTKRLTRRILGLLAGVILFLAHRPYPSPSEDGLLIPILRPDSST